jgi:hypothetical protein
MIKVSIAKVWYQKIWNSFFVCINIITDFLFQILNLDVISFMCDLFVGIDISFLAVPFLLLNQYRSLKPFVSSTIANPGL